MDFISALRLVVEAKGKLWARPTGSTMHWGITVSYEGFFNEVPDACGGMPAMLPSPSRIFGEWEVFNPSIALQDKDFEQRAEAVLAGFPLEPLCDTMHPEGL